MNKELQIKLEKLRNIYRSHNANGILIEKQNNISWLIRGNSRIGIASENGVCNLLLNDENLYLLTNNIEKNRLLFVIQPLAS